MGSDIIDTLNRAAKLYIDAGKAATVDDAMARLRSFRMHLAIDAAAATSPTHQAAMLTALNCGVRSFLGGVSVSGAMDSPMLVDVAFGKTLGDVVRSLGGTVTESVPAETALVVIGGDSDAAAPIALRTTFDGWRGGVVPARGTDRLPERVEFTPAGVLAGAFAVAEVFAHLDGDAVAGHRTVGLSLWDLSAEADWRDAASDGPSLERLPSDFWIIGLGHLGQAFLWTIGLLPYADPAKVRLFLQDVDRAGRSTQSTSILTGPNDTGRWKTRICADWAEARGFEAHLIERRFGPDLKASMTEPKLALCGVDNPDARRILESADFAMAFEAGLGNGADDFRLVRTHSFPGPKRAAEIWPTGDFDQQMKPAPAIDPRTLSPAYVDLLESGGLDTCGLTLLAEVAVGAPFVGTVAAAVVIAQVLRTVAGGPRPTVFNLDLRAVCHRSVQLHHAADVVVFGTTEARRLERAALDAEGQREHVPA